MSEDQDGVSSAMNIYAATFRLKDGQEFKSFEKFILDTEINETKKEPE